MDGLSSQEIFRAQLAIFLASCAFWAILCFVFIGLNPFSVCLTVALSILFAWLYGKIGWLLFPVPGGIAAFFAIIVLVLAQVILPPSAPSSTSAPFANPVPPPDQETLASQQKTYPLKVYHGTSLINAPEIFTTGLWLVGQPTPSGVYMADDINIAKNYSGNDGGIVIVQVAPNTDLTYRGNGIYLFEIPGAAPNQNYYEIDEPIPVAVLDPATLTRIR